MILGEAGGEKKAMGDKKKVDRHCCTNPVSVSTSLFYNIFTCW